MSFEVSVSSFYVTEQLVVERVLVLNHLHCVSKSNIVIMNLILFLLFLQIGLDCVSVRISEITSDRRQTSAQVLTMVSVTIL